MMNSNDHRWRTHRVECWLSQEEYQSLWEFALREDRTASSGLRQALNAYLQRDAEPKRTSLFEIRLMRQLDAEKHLVVNGRLRPASDNAAQGRAMDFALQLVKWADSKGD